MTNIETLEYTYEDRPHRSHLDDTEALEKYKKEKTANPDALIVLDDLDCGHWGIDVYETQEEKEVFYQNYVSSLKNKWLDRFRQIYK